MGTGANKFKAQSVATQFELITHSLTKWHHVTRKLKPGSICVNKW